jgi:hypothetical protein
MFKLPEFPSIDFSGLDVNALRQSELAKRISAIELPKIDLPKIDTEKVVAIVRDAAYLTVGLGAVAVERAQASRRRLATTVEARLARVDERVDAAEARVDEVIDRIENVLPEQAGHLVGQARDMSRVARKQVRGLIRTAA